MTEIRVEVVPVKLEPHPNADSLSIARVFDYPVIVRTEEWVDKQIGAYIPVDAVVPDTEPYAFLDGHLRIKARKFRGIFSMGLLTDAPLGSTIGDNVAEQLGIIKYDPPEPMTTYGESTLAPAVFVPRYTDIEHLLRYPDLFAPGEWVVATEKIHGANARYLWNNDEIHVGSHNEWKKENPGSIWWRALTPALRDFVQANPDMVVYGEVYGAVQDLKYGYPKGQVNFVAFDILDLKTSQYLHYYDFIHLTAGKLLTAPEIIVGPFDPEVFKAAAENDSDLADGQPMEGLVLRPVFERYNALVGRVILKYHSQRYLLRKAA